MNPVYLLGRFIHYIKRHGIRMTVERLWLSFRRVLSGNRLVLFYCDLADLHCAATGKKQTGWTVESRNSEKEISAADSSRIVNVGYADAVRKLQIERFARGARLWLLRVDGRIAAYGWTLKGDTIEPHFFPLGPQDVHLFDFFVFPEFRGQRLNCALVEHILSSLALEKRGRAFIEAAEWNTPQLRSLGRMPFRRLGIARKFCVGSRTFTIWSRGCQAEEVAGMERKLQSGAGIKESDEQVPVADRSI
jgi:hypothetical protein